ncbi:MAG: hypothetical protein R3F30_12760 [Planctomycetota bacterium]
MDLNDLWQQHKAWILGVVAGIVVFLVGSSLIQGNYPIQGAKKSISASTATLRSSLYTRDERDQARQRGEALEKRLAQLEQRLVFQPRADFVLDGQNADPSVYYLRKEGGTKAALQESLEAAGVEILAMDLGMPAEPPIGREDKQLFLNGLDLVDDTLQRLLASARVAQQQSPEAHGLRALEKVTLDTGTGSKGRGRATPRGRGGDEDQGTRVKAQLKLRCDARTLEVFLEQALGEDGRRPLLVSNLKAEDVGDNPGQPLLVNLEMTALLPEN